MAGLREESKASANEYLRRNPNYEYEFQLSTEPFARVEDRAHYIEAMEKAGLAPAKSE